MRAINKEQGKRGNSRSKAAIYSVRAIARGGGGENLALICAYYLWEDREREGERGNEIIIEG